MSRSNTLTAGYSSELSLYNVEVLWSFSGLGRGSLQSFSTIGGKIIKQQISQIIRCKKSELFEKDTEKR